MTINELIKKYEKKINHYEEKYSDTAVINFSEIAEWKAYQEMLQDLKQLKEKIIKRQFTKSYISTNQDNSLMAVENMIKEIIGE